MCKESKKVRALSNFSKNPRLIKHTKCANCMHYFNSAMCETCSEFKHVSSGKFLPCFQDINNVLYPILPVPIVAKEIFKYLKSKDFTHRPDRQKIYIVEV